MSQRSSSAEAGGFGHVLRGSLHLLTGQALRLLSLVAYLVLVIRGLGAEDFGRYSAVQALLLGLVPFTGLGFPILALREVARDPAVGADLWKAGVRVVLVLGSVASLPLLYGSKVLALSRAESPDPKPGSAA